MTKEGVGKIMIVDDEDVVRELVSDMVNSFGYDVVDFSDPKKAIDYYKLNYESISLVFLDMIMPGLNGRETFFLLKKINRDVQSVILSGFSLNEDIEKILEEGCYAYLKKPIKMDELEKTLNMVLNSKKKQATEIVFDDDPEIISFSEHNMDEELENMGMNAEIFVKMLKGFVENYSDAGNRMVNFAKEKKYNELFVFSHSIKSIAAGIGLLRLKAFSEAIEGSCLEKNFTDIESEAEYFKTEMNNALDKVKEYLYKISDKDDSIKIAEKEETVETMVSYMDLLIKFAGKGRPRAVREVFEKNILPAIAPFLDGNFKSDVAKMIKGYDFNDLESYLKEVKNDLNKG